MAHSAAQLRKLAPRKGKSLAADITKALTEQTVVVPGTNAAVIVLPRLALHLITQHKQRDEVALEVEQRGLAPPLYPILTSMPGAGVRTAARFLTKVVCRTFASAAYFAAYAGLAPVSRRSSSSRGNKTLKRALFLSAFAGQRAPISNAYYTRKINQGKRHNQALIALARQRCDVLFTMMHDGTFYTPQAS